MDDRSDALRQRIEILSAVLAAIDRRAEVWALVGTSSTADEARANLEDLLGISSVAARAVLDLQVRRFAVQEVSRIREELEQLQQQTARDIRDISMRQDSAT